MTLAAGDSRYCTSKILTEHQKLQTSRCNSLILGEAFRVENLVPNRISGTIQIY